MRKDIQVVAALYSKSVAVRAAVRAAVKAYPLIFDPTMVTPGAEYRAWFLGEKAKEEPSDRLTGSTKFLPSHTGNIILVDSTEHERAARRLAQWARKRGFGDVFLGVHMGLITRYGGRHLVPFIAALHDSPEDGLVTNITEGRSVLIPDWATTTAVRSRWCRGDLQTFLEILTHDEKDDAAEYFSGGVVNTTQLVQEAITCALAPIIHATRHAQPPNLGKMFPSHGEVWAAA